MSDDSNRTRSKKLHPWVQERLLTELRAFCRDHGRTRDSVIEEALRTFLDSQRDARCPTR